jgi:hypothetical protein
MVQGKDDSRNKGKKKDKKEENLCNENQQNAQFLH